jgi:hypothetical protein
MVDSGWFNSVVQTSKSIGSVDADAWQHRMAEGWDPVNIPSRYAWELLAPAPTVTTGSNQGFPFSWSEPVLGYGITYTVTQAGVLSNATFFSNMANGICHSVGDGAAMNRVGLGVQTGLAVGYPGGSSYTNGTYTNVPLTGGSGAGALATVVVSGGAVSTVTPTTPGNGYVAGDGLSAAAIGGTGSGFSVPVATVTGSYQINRYLYRFLETEPCAIANTGSGGKAVLTCTAPITNMGFEYGQVYIVGAGSAPCPAFMGGGSNCLSASILPGGISSNGEVINLSVAAGTTFSTQSTKVQFYRLQPGDPVTTGAGLGASGCAPHPTQTTVTVLTLNIYVKSDGAVGFSENQNSQYSEGTYRCQWDGKMAGFFEDEWYPQIFTEDNAAHAFMSLHTNALAYATAWEQVPRSSHLAAQLASVEDSGLCPNYSGPFGGACYRTRLPQVKWPCISGRSSRRTGTSRRRTTTRMAPRYRPQVRRSRSRTARHSPRSPRLARLQH